MYTISTDTDSDKFNLTTYYRKVNNRLHCLTCKKISCEIYNVYILSLYRHQYIVDYLQQSHSSWVLRSRNTKYEKLFEDLLIQYFWIRGASVASTSSTARNAYVHIVFNETFILHLPSHSTPHNQCTW